MTTERIDVLAVMDAAIERNASLPSVAAHMTEARAAVAELIEADRASVNRHIEEKGCLDIEFDALRKACARFVEAQFRRNAALDRVGGAK